MLDLLTVFAQCGNALRNFNFHTLKLRHIRSVYCLKSWLERLCSSPPLQQYSYLQKCFKNSFNEAECKKKQVSGYMSIHLCFVESLTIKGRSCSQVWRPFCWEFLSRQNNLEWRQELGIVSCWSCCLYIETEHIGFCYEAESFVDAGCLWEWGSISVPAKQLCVTLAAAWFLGGSCLESGEGVER